MVRIELKKTVSQEKNILKKQEFLREEQTTKRTENSTYQVSVIVTNEMIHFQPVSETMEKNVSSQTMYEMLNVKLNIFKNLIFLFTCIIPIVSTIT